METGLIAEGIHVNKNNIYDLVNLEDNCKVYNVKAIIEALGDCDNSYIKFLYCLQNLGDKKWEFIGWCDQVARFSPAAFREAFNYPDKSKIYEIIRQRGLDVVRWRTVWGLNNFFEVILYRLKKAEPLMCNVKHVEGIAISTFVLDCMQVLPVIWICNGYIEVKGRLILRCGELYDLACRLIQWEEDVEAVRKFKGLMLTMNMKKQYICNGRIDPLKEEDKIVAGK